LLRIREIAQMLLSGLSWGGGWGDMLGAFTEILHL
jgi:hypothetical protein